MTKSLQSTISSLLFHNNNNGTSFEFQGEYYFPIAEIYRNPTTWVYKCRKMSDQSLMVFKIIHDDSGLLETGETRSEYLQKYKHTNHANVLSMKTFNNYNDDDEASITLREYVIISKFRGNNLRDVRKNLERVSILMVLQIIVQCCGALQSLSLNHIIHRDVKPENIFMSEEGMIVLGDLGCATMAENNLDDMLLLNEENNEQLVDDCTSSCYSSATGFAGTIGFIAPEILNGKCYIRNKPV